MTSFRSLLIILFGLYSLSGCTSTELASSLYKQQYRPQYKVGNPYVVEGQQYYPAEVASYVEEGEASWYGPGFHGHETANGEQFDTEDMTAAHRTLPMPSVVRVTNLENGKSVVVRVNDRGPFKRNRIIDVSKSAAKALDFHGQGTTHVRVEFMPVESHIVAEAAKRGEILALNDVLARTGGGNNGSINGTVMPAVYLAASAPPANVSVSAANTNGWEQSQEATYQPAAYQVPDAASPDAHVLHASVSQAAYTVPAPRAAIRPVYVQVGAYASREHAAAIRQKLSRIGQVQMDTVERGGVKLYRLRLAANDARAANGLLERVGSLGYGGAKVVKD